MIVRVWGTINSKCIEFEPIEDRPGYWEGIGPKEDIYQDIEIWAKNDLGAVGHLRCTIVIREWTPTEVRLIIAPYRVDLIKEPYKVSIFEEWKEVLKCERA